jgi:hypothetical protein
MSVSHGLSKLGLTAMQAMVKKIAQIIDMESWSGVDLGQLSHEELKVVISSSTFLKEKYDAESIFEKL